MRFTPTPIHRYYRRLIGQVPSRLLLATLLYALVVASLVALGVSLGLRAASTRLFERRLTLDPFRLRLQTYATAYNMLRPGRDSCANRTMFVGIMSVGGSYAAFLQRQAIREYMMDKAEGKGVVYKFFMGHQAGFRHDLVQEEMRRHDDIVYYDADDTYRNNFVKWYAMYQYHLAYCGGTRFFVKLDEDTALDLDRLFRWMARSFDGLTVGKQDYMVCQRFAGMRPVREKANQRWYIPPEEYPHRFWPTYCYGYMVLMPGGTVRRLVEAAQQVALIHMDDVLLTGLAARVAQVPVFDFEGFREGIRPRYACTEDGLPYPTAVHLQKTPKAMQRTMETLRRLNCSLDDLNAP